MTYADKLNQWRREFQQLATELMEDDDFAVAQKVVAAAAVMKQVHNELCDLGLDDCEWTSEATAVGKESAP